jgi:serine protease Do
MTLSPLTEELRAELGLESNVDGLAVREVEETAEAFEKGIRSGDVISEAGQQKVLTLKDLKDRIDDAKEAGRKSLLLLVRRAGEPRFVALGVE